MPAITAMMAITISSSTMLKASVLPPDVRRPKRIVPPSRRRGQRAPAAARESPKIPGTAAGNACITAEANNACRRRALVTAVHRALGIRLDRRGIGRVGADRAVRGIVDPANGRARAGGDAALALLGANGQARDRSQVRPVNVRGVLG